MINQDDLSRINILVEQKQAVEDALKVVQSLRNDITASVWPEDEFSSELRIELSTHMIAAIRQDAASRLQLKLARVKDELRRLGYAA